MTRTALIASLLAVVAAAGCGGSSGAGAPNKSGASSATRAHVLELQATDPGSPEAQYFAKRSRHDRQAR